jgi:hypothetical protein
MRKLSLQFNSTDTLRLFIPLIPFFNMENLVSIFMNTPWAGGPVFANADGWLA